MVPTHEIAHPATVLAASPLRRGRADRHGQPAGTTGEQQLGGGGGRPLERVPDAIRSQIHNNTALMIGLGLQGTPALVFEDSQGRWRLAPGVVGEEALRAEVFQISEQ